MEPWVGMLIFFGFIVFVIIMSVALIGMSRGGGSPGGQKFFLGLKNYHSQGTIKKFKLHQDFLTKDWKIATQDRDKAIIRESGLMKRPEHELDLNDYIILQDKETGFSMVFEGISILVGEISKDNRKLKTELDRVKSEKSILLTRNHFLEKHVDKIVDKRIGDGEQMNIKLKQFYNKDKK